jgi:hypothetical protein
MVEIVWILNTVMSLVISIIINFDAKVLSLFILRTLLIALFIFGILSLLIKSIQNAIKKNKKRAILFGIFFVLTVVVFSFGYIRYSSGGLCARMVTPAHFRTNIFTGKCEFGGYSNCWHSDPWYYKPDCDSVSVKIKVLKNTKYYELMLEECNRFCENNEKVKFCRTSQLNYWDDGSTHIDCNLLTTCDTISCD